MDLVLLALQVPAAEPRTRLRARFGPGGGRVGRDPACALVLARAERQISREHLMFQFRAGTYELVVTSRTNGVRVDDKLVPSGGRCRLQGGERIGLGGYLFQVAFEPEESSQPGGRVGSTGSGGAASVHDDWLHPSARQAVRGEPAAYVPRLAAAEPDPGWPAALDAGHDEDIFAALDAPVLTELGDRAASSGGGRECVDLPMRASPRTGEVATSSETALRPMRESADLEALDALIGGAGLRREDVDDADPRATLARAGRLLRLSVEGWHRLLARRGVTRADLHVGDRTAIATRENNPLKHAETAHDALQHLLDARQHVSVLFLRPEQAIHGAIEDIAAHDDALVAGFRAALQAALQAFDPSAFTGNTAPPPRFDGMFGARRKARWWDEFVARHADLQARAGDRFERLAESAFAHGYATHARTHRDARKGRAADSARTARSAAGADASSTARRARRSDSDAFGGGSPTRDRAMLE